MSGRRATARRSSEPDGGSVGEVSAAPQFADVSRRGLAADPNTVVTPEAVYLAAEASDYVTGSDIVIDGGYCAW